MDNLPVVIANVQELDALCRAWLGYDSAVVERLEGEREYLLAELGRMSSLADEYHSERDDARAVVEAARVYCASEYAGVAGYHAATENLFMALKQVLAVYDEVGAG